MSLARNDGRSRLEKVAVVSVDALVSASALVAGYLIRFDLEVPPDYSDQLLKMLPIVVLIRLAALYYAGSYRFLWKYTSISDLLPLLRATLSGLIAIAVVNYFGNYAFGLIAAVTLYVSVLVHRGVLHFLPRTLHKRVLSAGALVGGLALLVAASMTLQGGLLREDRIDGTFLPFDFTDALGMPRGVLVLESILNLALATVVRMTPRVLQAVIIRRDRKGRRRAVIFGAGDLGEGAVRGLLKGFHPDLTPVAFVDDDPAKHGLSIHGVRVYGARSDLASIIEQVRADELLIAVSNLPDPDLRSVAAVCKDQGISLRRVPSLAAMDGPGERIRNLERVDVEELLGRPEVQLDPARVEEYLENQVVMVTGAGGSIGSELCRQIIRFNPSRLVLVGKGENSIYEIQNELDRATSTTRVDSVIADVGSTTKMDFILGGLKPSVVFHAAAHKHVPFMEQSPEESVLNNIFGTMTVARAAIKHGCSRFVMVSTDKAVNPTSVMGATKRVAEMILQHLALTSTTSLITVRFGNVLRSRGSVVPLFERQIAAGGPVTVTDPEMKRFFMSIPEAVRLILHSGAIGANGELCILDMGEQVSIVQMVESMIRRTGKVPYEEVDIQFTGVRPGEKLYEELFTDQERQSIRRSGEILVAKPEKPDDSLMSELEVLRDHATACDREGIIQSLCRLVPSYDMQGWQAATRQ